MRLREELAKKLPFAPDPTGLGCNAHPLYEWQHSYIHSIHRFNFLCAANQIGKSIANWIRLLRFCYLPSYWDKYFSGNAPMQFWYFYPSATLSTAEIRTKYLRHYLPDESLKNHKKWGYKVDMENKIINAIHFNSGVTCYFKSYAQPPGNLQAATLSGVFADEEMPEPILDELNFRGVSQDDFYYHNVFTATKGQEYLRRTIEEIGSERELFSDAFKRQVSMYDCLKYNDGSDSIIWTPQKIEQAKAQCTSEAEILRRVYGRFVISESRKFHSFDHKRNTTKGHTIPRNWLHYSGLDWGSGGKRGHPSAILFLAVSPDYKRGRIYLCWRGDGIPTTQGDVVRRYSDMKKDVEITEAAYDYSARDIGTIASRVGIPISRANKERESSIELINTLFKNGQLKIYTGKGYEENDKLISEVASALDSGPKVKDDLIDALRYACNLVPWQFEILREEKEEGDKVDVPELSNREYFWKYGYEGSELWEQDPIDSAFEDYMEMYESYEL
jgi:hypothetical protein